MWNKEAELLNALFTSGFTDRTNPQDCLAWTVGPEKTPEMKGRFSRGQRG